VSGELLGVERGCTTARKLKRPRYEKNSATTRSAEGFAHVGGEDCKEAQPVLSQRELVTAAVFFAVKQSKSAANEAFPSQEGRPWFTGAFYRRKGKTLGRKMGPKGQHCHALWKEPTRTPSQSASLRLRENIVESGGKHQKTSRTRAGSQSRSKDPYKKQAGDS